MVLVYEVTIDQMDNEGGGVKKSNTDIYMHTTACKYNRSLINQG